MHELLIQRLGVLSLLALVGCASVAPPPVVQEPVLPKPPPPPIVVPAPPPPPPPAVPDPVAEAGRQLLRWQESLRQVPPEAVAALATRLAAEPATPEGTVHLAMAWLQSRAPGDSARALALLEAVQKSPDPAAQPWTDWARLLVLQALEQKRLEDLIERQAAQLRDSQRRMDQLNEKLEALKNIERSLAPRGNGNGNTSSGSSGASAGTLRGGKLQ
ncbi:hypothetical protein [Rhodoferax sp.]|uniref:hypothetical protein n=1 Tax=Rhodoferax sp. TaxID=50421 RepID=UPI00374C95E3